MEKKCEKEKREESVVSQTGTENDEMAQPGDRQI